MCLLTITKPFASELETHTSKINVSPVSATLYTFMANAQAWYGFLQNVYKFSILHCTRSARARCWLGLLTRILRQILTRITDSHFVPIVVPVIEPLLHITNTNTQCIHTNYTSRNKYTYTVHTHKKTAGFTSPHAPAVMVEKYSFFFYVLVEASSYAISTFYRIKIGQKLETRGPCTKKV